MIQLMMIKSRREQLYDYPISHREHRYVGGPPSLRLRRLQNRHEHRARKYGVEWDFVDPRHVYAKGNGLCLICLQPLSLDEFTIDHEVPLSRGGPHLLWNLQPAHRSCNSRKGDR